MLNFVATTPSSSHKPVVREQSGERRREAPPVPRAVEEPCLVAPLRRLVSCSSFFAMPSGRIISAPQLPVHCRPHKTAFFDILYRYMSQEKKKEERTHARTGRNVPKSADINPSRSGWLALLIVAGTFVAMRFLGQSGGERTEDISVTGFRRAVEEHRVAKVERVRDLDSGSTYLRGEYLPHSGTNSAFRVRLVPGENEKLMSWLVEKGIDCPVTERSPLIGPLFQQLLFFLLLLSFQQPRRLTPALIKFE